MMNPLGFFPQVSTTSPGFRIFLELLMGLYVPASSSSAATAENGSAAIVATSSRTNQLALTSKLGGEMAPPRISAARNATC